MWEEIVRSSAKREDALRGRPLSERLMTVIWQVTAASITEATTAPTGRFPRNEAAPE